MVDSNNGTIKKKKVVVKKKTETSPRIKDISETEFDELDIKPKSRVRRKSSTSNTSEKSFKFDSIEKEEPIEEIKPIETKNNNIDLTTKLKNFRNNRKRRVVEVEREVPSVTKVLKAELEVEKAITILTILIRIFNIISIFNQVFSSDFFGWIKLCFLPSAFSAIWTIVVPSSNPFRIAIRTIPESFYNSFHCDILHSYC